jgi:rare lipoprotein A
MASFDTTCRPPRGGLRSAAPWYAWVAAVVVNAAGCATVHGPGGSAGAATEPGPGAPSGDPSREPAAKPGGEDAPRAGGQAGKATYYSDKLAGRKTASGEPYDPELFTAAHRTLPLGTWVEVTSAKGKRVRVKINDRGPFGKEDRIIDLSKRAAREIDLLRAGVMSVTVRVVDGP